MTPEEMEAALKRRCLTHTDPRLWQDAPAASGKIRTTCRKCGWFIGLRPAERDKNQTIEPAKK